MGRLDELREAVGVDVDLTETEASVVDDLYHGRPVHFDNGEEIRGLVLRQLFVHADKARDGIPGRFSMEGGKVTGLLSLTGLRLEFGLCFAGTEFAKLDLTDTRLPALDILGGSATAIDANRIDVAHDLVLSDGFNCGRVGLLSAQISGDLNLTGATLTAPENRASLIFDGARIGARVYLRDEIGSAFHANHGVYGRNARVAGGILCTGGVFDDVLDFTRIQIQGVLSLNRATIKGDVALTGARVSSDLTLNGTRLLGSEFSLARGRVDGSLTWKPRQIGGENSKLKVDLTQARIGFLDDDLGWDGTRLRLEGFSFSGVAVPSGVPDWVRKRKQWLARQTEADTGASDTEPWSHWSAYPYDQLRGALQSWGMKAPPRQSRSSVRRNAESTVISTSAIGFGTSSTKSSWVTLQAVALFCDVRCGHRRFRTELHWFGRMRACESRSRVRRLRQAGGNGSRV